MRPTRPIQWRLRLLAAIVAAATAAGCRCTPYKAGESRRAVDFHTHISYGMGTFAAELFERGGIQVAVNLSGQPFGRPLLARLDEARQVSADNESVEILVFSGVNWRLVDEPDFGALAADDLRAAVQAGARGLKISKALGLGVRTADGRLLPVDTVSLDPLWETAAELGVPVAIHTGDPVAFFQPPTPDNPRIEELRAHPSWSFYGEDYPTLAALLAARDRLVARHPKTTFVAVHVGGLPEDLDAVADSMRKLSNLWIDIAARLPEIGRHDPGRVASFFEEFQDRILFGTDLQLSRYGITLGSGGPEDEPTPEDVVRYYGLHWRYFETRDRRIQHMTPIQGRWTIDAIALSRPVLDKLYRENGRRLLNLK